MTDTLAKINAKLDKFLENNPQVDKYLVMAQEKVKVKKIYLVCGLIAIVGGWLIFGHGAALLCNAIGFLYPMYMSIKALETDDKELKFSLFSKTNSVDVNATTTIRISCHSGN